MKYFTDPNRRSFLASCLGGLLGAALVRSAPAEHVDPQRIETSGRVKRRDDRVEERYQRAMLKNGGDPGGFVVWENPTYGLDGQVNVRGKPVFCPYGEFGP